MFVDIHAHAYRRQPVYGMVKRRWAMPETLLSFYDKYNVEKGVLLPVVSPECNAIQSNEDILEAAERYPGRFIPFCNVDPRAINNTPHAPLELHLEQYKDAGCKGLGEVMANYSFYDPMMQNLFRAAEKVGLPVTIHVTHRIGGCYGIYDEPGLPGLAETLGAHPNLKIFGHSAAFWAEISELDLVVDRAGYPKGKVKEGAVPKLMRRYPNLIGDLSANSGANALIRDPEYAVQFINEFQDRLCFGMDICLEPFENNIKLIPFLLELRDTGKISEEVFRKVAHDNALRILGVS
ncbi:MAG: amidohydrolase family protein [Lentisphaeria bacterium]|nr:amidohydrolase family protein [Lentisphaeria bacterium]